MFEAYVPGQASGMDEYFATLLALVGDLVVLLLMVPRQVPLGCKHITTILAEYFFLRFLLLFRIVSFSVSR